VNRRFPVPANAETLKRRNFPAAGTGPQKHPVKRGQRLREIKPVRFKLLVYFGRPAIAGMVSREPFPIGTEAPAFCFDAFEPGPTPLSKSGAGFRWKTLEMEGSSITTQTLRARVGDQGLAWVAVVVIPPFLIAPALWNGYPLLQWDTGGYLARWYEGYLVRARSTGFGLYLHYGEGSSFWINLGL